MFLTDPEKARLQQQIRELEAATDAELVTVIAGASDSYTFIPILWAAIISLCLPGFYYLLTETGLNSWFAAEDLLERLRTVYIGQVLLFLALLILFQWTPVQMVLIPTSVKRLRAHRHAQMQFVQQRVHWTHRRAGILLFVSVAEHYVEIIADKAIAQSVDDQVWEKAITHFVEKVKEGQVAEGFSAAISDCGAVLLTHFPATETRPDELPNHLIEV